MDVLIHHNDVNLLNPFAKKIHSELIMVTNESFLLSFSVRMFLSLYWLATQKRTYARTILYIMFTVNFL